MLLQIFLFLDSLGGGELLLIFVVILLFFGPKSIPEIAKAMGKMTREFRNAMNDVRSEIETSMDARDKTEAGQKAEDRLVDEPAKDSPNVSSGNNISQRKIFGQQEDEKNKT